VSGFSTVNLLEVEDSMGDRAPGIEGRFGRKHLGSRDLGVSLFRYAPNLRSPMGHSHREQEEAYVVVAGSGRILLNDEVHDLRQWDVVRVAPEVVRAFEAGPDGLDVIAVGGPKPVEGDVCPAQPHGPTRRSRAGLPQRSGDPGIDVAKAQSSRDRHPVVAVHDVVAIRETAQHHRR
jgi:quercetin dioxygenase-like cupin family protein